MKVTARFYLLGLLVAGLEEFITQGVLKNTCVGWILPTIIAFLPFLVLARAMGKPLDHWLSEPAAVLGYYVTAGTVGLLVEWFVIGLSPWRDPQASIAAILLFQLGMFSFWGSVALIPRILLDTRSSVSRVRRSVTRAVILGFGAIYALTFLSPSSTRFAVGVISVLIMFLGLNFLFLQYIRALMNPLEGKIAGTR